MLLIKSLGTHFPRFYIFRLSFEIYDWGHHISFLGKTHGWVKFRFPKLLMFFVAYFSLHNALFSDFIVHDRDIMYREFHF